MPKWLDQFFHPNNAPPWTDEHYTKPTSLTVLTSNHHTFQEPMMATPTTTTATDLPLPVISSSTNARASKKSARFDNLSVHWARFRKRMGAGTVLDNSSLLGESAAETNYIRRLENAETSDFVDEVVVDRMWSEEIKSSVTHSDHGASPEKSGTSHPPERGTGTSDHESVSEEKFKALTMLRYRAVPLFMEIFSSRFLDDKAEQHYAQESWFLKKSLALWASLWLIVNWVLGCIFIPHNPFIPMDKIFYFGVAPFLSLPIVFMVLYDWPRDRPITYQVFLVISIWCWSFYQIIFIIECGFYTASPPHCGGRDFMSTFYYTSALQTIALFGLKLNRFPAALGALVFMLFASIAIIPHRNPWARNMINFFIFQTFLIYVHYVRESSERRLYTLRDQLKMQFKATQKAQINERKASDSKRRLTSYVFHDKCLGGNPVRVPLNTALLAVQNMEASGTVAKDQEIEFNALCGSLSMMSKVLNDVLDFNRMDSGRFESASRPYGFHQVMRSLFVPLRLATDARGLKFETELDPNIDKVAREAAYTAMGESTEAIRNHIAENPNVDGIVIGDDTRLRQIITNLASNACKFTPSGGKLSIKTRLIIPYVSSSGGAEDSVVDSTANANDSHVVDETSDDKQRPLSTDYLTQHNNHGKPTAPLETIVVRIEVSDTGFGIKPQDMQQCKLFSAFNQTEQGRQQGGKGTGLGLALVRQIVKLSGGRLGVQSKVGEGSTFWVELPLGVGRKTFITPPPELPEGSSSSELDTLRRTGTGFTKRGCSKSGSGSGSGTRTGSGTSSGAGTGTDTGTGTGTGTGAATGVETSSQRRSSSVARTNSALQGIMEQGGRVELTLRAREVDQQTTSPTDERSQDDPALEEDGTSLLNTTTVNAALPVDATRTHSQEDAGLSGLVTPTAPEPNPSSSSSSSQHLKPAPSIPPESGRANPIQRPTYVQLPPKTFGIDGNELLMQRSPTEPSSSHSQKSVSSEKSSHNLKLFDSNCIRGSPSASFAGLNIEPGLPVLVVDDDQLTRTLMKRILTRLGCKVWCAENGEVGLEMILGQRISATVGSTPSSDTSRITGPILEHPTASSVVLEEGGKFAVVFLDNQMPIMSGLKVVAKVRELGRDDFIVGVTGNALLSDQEEYLEAGADRVLTKPVLERSLRDILLLADEKRKAHIAEGDKTPRL